MKVDGQVVRARVPNGAQAIPVILGALDDAGIAVASVTTARPSLDDVYLHYTGRAFSTEDASRLMQAIRQTGWMVVRQLRNISRQPIWVVMMIIQPMIWLILYGQLFKNVGAQGHAPTAGSYIEFLAPGIICMNAFFGGMWSGMGMITDLDRKVVDRFLAAPASRLRDRPLAGRASRHHRDDPDAHPAASSVSRSASACTAASLGWLVIFAAAFLLASAFAGFSNGLALIFRRPESMIATANMVGLPMMFLSSILVTVRSDARLDPGGHSLQPGELGRSRRAERVVNPAAPGVRPASTSCSCSRRWPRPRSSRRGASARTSARSRGSRTRRRSPTT